MLDDLVIDHKYIFTIEENVIIGGYGQSVTQYLVDGKISNMIIKSFGIPDKYIEHGNVDILKNDIRLDKDSLIEDILKIVEN